MPKDLWERYLEDNPATSKWVVSDNPLNIGLWDPFQMAIHGL